MMLSRVSYAALFWPGMAEFADYRVMPKYVVSTTLDEADLVDNWGETTIWTRIEARRGLRDGLSSGLNRPSSRAFIGVHPAARPLVTDGVVDHPRGFRHIAHEGIGRPPTKPAAVRPLMFWQNAHTTTTSCDKLTGWMALDCMLDALRRWRSKRSPILGSWWSTALAR
jgi:hypothetical protein